MLHLVEKNLLNLLIFVTFIILNSYSKSLYFLTVKNITFYNKFHDKVNIQTYGYVQLKVNVWL